MAAAVAVAAVVVGASALVGPGFSPGALPDEAQRPAYLNLDRKPGPSWQVATCTDIGRAPTGVHHRGVLTIDAPGQTCWQYLLRYPDGVWNRFADNTRGWVVEAGVEVDPLSRGRCTASTPAQLWIHDDTMLVVIGISASQVCLVFPDRHAVAKDMTEGFHNVRVEARGRIVRLYVDGTIALDHTLSFKGDGTRALGFGDGNGTGRPAEASSRSRWDYVSYDTTPRFTAGDWRGSDWPVGARVRERRPIG